MNITMDMYQSLGFAVIWLLIGRYLKDHVKFFQKYCIPAPIIGGFLFAMISLIGHNTGFVHFSFDKTLQNYWMVMFFTTVGYNAGFSVLKKGGVKVFIFLLAAVGLAVLQHVVAQGVARAIHFNPMLAVMLGSTSFTGGFGTAAAFAPLVDPDGTLGALTLAVAVPTFSSIISSIMGGPVGNGLISRFNLAPNDSSVQVKVDESGNIIKQTTERTTVQLADNRSFIRRLFSRQQPRTEEIVKVHEEVVHSRATKLEAGNTKQAIGHTLNSEKVASSFMLLVVAVGLGLFVTHYLNSLSSKTKFPIYIGTMLVAAVIRNIADSTKLFHIEMDAMDTLGSISLNMFLAMALASLELWKLVDLAIPLFVILGAQIVTMYLFARFVTFNLMGRNYDAAVITAGHIGFGFAATPNAMANMGSVCEKYGYSEVAFFVVPIVGSLFIDLFNVMIISGTIAFVQVF